MGTLGCINDMMRRDKENRELRYRNRERMNETRNRLIEVKKRQSSRSSSETIKRMEKIAQQTLEREHLEQQSFFRGALFFILLVLGISVIVLLVIACFVA
ncbi:MAG: hypothetical protein Q4D36_10595 [Bacteroidales bacterium]|nr:hypothetical protein [Bacteroidales bacterium]